MVALLVGCSTNVVPIPLPTATPEFSQRALAIDTPLPTIQRPPSESTPNMIPLPSSTPYPEQGRFSIGESAGGRSIWAWRFGQGESRLVLIGGIHGGYEANSARLAELLVEHYEAHPDDLVPGVELVIIPVANPDGLENGSGLDARFNDNGVDLNRNWGCDWEPTAYVRDIEVSPGPRPFSEPETEALRSFFLAYEPHAIVFYHSAVGAIYMGTCGDHLPADWMGDLLAEATRYPYHASFDYYEVSGDATDWLAEQGIPAATVELYTRDSPEFERNFPGVQALQCELAGRQAQTRTTADFERLCP